MRCQFLYWLRQVVGFKVAGIWRIIVSIKRPIKSSMVLLSLALLFVFTGTESRVFSPGTPVISLAEAAGDKDKDKDDDMGGGEFIYDQDAWTFSGDCSNVSKLRIRYHKDFITTENASGPNIIVTGADGTDCSIAIEKISGGNKCGFSALKANGKLFIDTKTKNNAQNCEMCIKVVVPRTMKILG